MIPLVTWNLRVSARACGSVLSWSRTLCGSLEKAASVGAKIVKGVAWRQKYIKWSFTLSIHVCVYILIVFTVLCKKVQENIFFKRTRFDTSTLVLLIIKIKIEMNT